MEYTIGDKSYPTEGFIESKTGEQIPLVRVKMMSDYKWQKRALDDRLAHPEHYSGIENVEEAIAGLRTWLAAYTLATA